MHRIETVRSSERFSAASSFPVNGRRAISHVLASQLRTAASCNAGAATPSARRAAIAVAKSLSSSRGGCLLQRVMTSMPGGVSRVR
jgi:hypothetical protein